MFTTDQYQLLDFGIGRRLERFGPVTLDRPCPAVATLPRAHADLWSHADARFDGREAEKGIWTDQREVPERWTIVHSPLCFELKRTDFGHLGLFPEQAENWNWIIEQISPRSLEEGKVESDRESAMSLHQPSPHPQPFSQRARGIPRKVLNLFAYTGGSTLAAAAAGAEVVHVDAAKNIVAWARRNAELSGLADAPIRWIAEDAMKFVKRELKRGVHYDAVILDPPSYGHGPRGEVWRLSKHLPRLLAMCRELTAGQAQFMLLTCHTPGYDAEQLSEMMKEHFFAGSSSGWMKAKPLAICTADDRLLPSGIVVRWKRSATYNQNNTP